MHFHLGVWWSMVKAMHVVERWKDNRTVSSAQPYLTVSEVDKPAEQDHDHDILIILLHVWYH